LSIANADCQLRMRVQKQLAIGNPQLEMIE